MRLNCIQWCVGPVPAVVRSQGKYGSRLPYRYQQDPRNANELRFEILEEMYEHCLLDLDDILANHRHDLKAMEGFAGIFPAIDSRANRDTNHSNTY